jgi:hypothetical protein
MRNGIYMRARRRMLVREAPIPANAGRRDGMFVSGLH